MKRLMREGMILARWKGRMVEMLIESEESSDLTKTIYVVSLASCRVVECMTKGPCIYLINNRVAIGGERYSSYTRHCNIELVD